MVLPAQEVDGIHVGLDSLWRNRMIAAGLIPRDLQLQPELKAVEAQYRENALREGLDPTAIQNEETKEAKYIFTWIVHSNTTRPSDPRAVEPGDGQVAFETNFVVYMPFARTTLASMCYRLDRWSLDQASSLRSLQIRAFEDAAGRFFTEIRKRVDRRPMSILSGSPLSLIPCKPTNKP